jgi:hypothetical protein
MCMSDLLTRLRSLGFDVSVGRVRWAIQSQRVSRPRLDSSLRFVFSDENISELVEYFRTVDQAARAEAAPCK